GRPVPVDAGHRRARGARRHPGPLRGQRPRGGLRLPAGGRGGPRQRRPQAAVRADDAVLAPGRRSVGGLTRPTGANDGSDGWAAWTPSPFRGAACVTSGPEPLTSAAFKACSGASGNVPDVMRLLPGRLLFLPIPDSHGL